MECSELVQRERAKTRAAVRDLVSTRTMRDTSNPMGLFLVSFLVLFLETALIRWLPAYLRLLAYFSNFILLASFLGIGLGCLVAGRARPKILWFPLLQLALIVAVDRLRLEVAVPSTSELFFSSGTTAPVVPV